MDNDSDNINDSAIFKQCFDEIKNNIYIIAENRLPINACSLCTLTDLEASNNQHLKGGSLFLDDLSGYRSFLCPDCTQFSKRMLLLMKKIFLFRLPSVKSTVRKDQRILSFDDRYERRSNGLLNFISKDISKTITNTSLDFLKQREDKYSEDRQLAFFMVKIISKSRFEDDSSDDCCLFLTITYFLLNLAFKSELHKIPSYKSRKINIFLSIIFGIGIPDPSTSCEYIDMNKNITFVTNYTLYRNNMRYVTVYTIKDNKFLIQNHDTDFCACCYKQGSKIRCEKCEAVLFCSNECERLMTQEHKLICDEIVRYKSVI